MKLISGGGRFGDIKVMWRFCIYPFANMPSALQAISHLIL